MATRQLHACLLSYAIPYNHLAIFFFLTNIICIFFFFKLVYKLIALVVEKMFDYTESKKWEAIVTFRSHSANDALSN